MKPFRLLALLSVIVIALAACRSGRLTQPPTGTGSALPVGSTTHQTTVDGQARTYRLYRPATVDAKAPLVIMLHGALGTGSQAEASYGWDAQADSGRFVVAYPDGYKRTWNVSGTCCGPAATAGIDDVAFITQLVKEVSALVPIDPARIYATGISNGGMLAYRLACDTTTFAAIGPDSATMLNSCAKPAPISVIHIHGTADQTIPYAGGPGARIANVNVDGPAVPALLQRWRGFDQCGQPAVTTAGPVTTSTATCPDGRSVELITIAGAGHQWPGSSGREVVQRLLDLDPPSTALNATSTIWRFFAAHPKP